MDGNGRWAKSKGLKRTDGHKEGSKIARKITVCASEMGIKYLTLYAFSTENWKRPKTEVDFLMKLLGKRLKKELKTYIENNVRFKTIGDISKFSPSLKKIIKNTEKETKDFTGLTQVLAVNYGSRNEIIRAIKAKEKDNNKIIDEENIEKYLDTAGMPEVDLLIRTGGEKRLSNFLLWQSAYAELFFTKTLWPDFTEQEFKDIIQEYKKTDRRFGGV